MMTMAGFAVFMALGLPLSALLLVALWRDQDTERELERFDRAVESVMDDSVDSPPAPEESR